MLELDDEPVSLPRAAESAIRTLAGRMPSVPMIIAGPSDPPAVHGDAAYVEHVLRNLITSATRFAGPGAPVIVRIEYLDDEVAVRVLDRRPEASPDELAMTFTLVDEPTAPRRLGLGIPLFVCRRLIESMGGNVWARPRETAAPRSGSPCDPIGMPGAGAGGRLTHRAAGRTRRPGLAPRPGPAAAPATEARRAPPVVSFRPAVTRRPRPRRAARSAGAGPGRPRRRLGGRTSGDRSRRCCRAGRPCPGSPSTTFCFASPVVAGSSSARRARYARTVPAHVRKSLAVTSRPRSPGGSR